jgi:hypothetical protein
MRILLAALALLLAGCSCDKGGAAQRARRLTQEQLGALHVKLTDALPANSAFYQLPADQFPAELASLKPMSIIYRGSFASVHLSGCMDDKVYLHVRGLGKEPSLREVVLSLGELEQQETLWRAQR